MKKTLLLILLISLLIPQTSMAKLSAREKAAKKAGGSLNYKTGKISVPSAKISTPSTSSLRAAASASVGGKSKVGNALTPQQIAYQQQLDREYISSGQAASDSSLYKQKAIDYSEGGSETVKAQKATRSRSATSSKPKAITPKSGAPTVENAASQTSNIGGGTISQGKAPSAINRILASLGQMWANNGLAQAAPTAFLTDEQRRSNFNEGLGIEGVNAAGPSALGDYLAKSATPESPTGTGPNGELYYNNYDPAVNGPTLLASDFATPGTNFSRPGSEVAYNQGQDPRTFGRSAQQTQIAYGSQPSARLTASRTPSPVSQPYTANISQVYAQPQEQVIAQQPDVTPVVQSQPGTQRRFLGNGILSNGVASNGKLDQNLDGLSFGAPASEEENLLRELLGVNTAQAAEMPQQTASFSQSVTPMSAFQNGFANGGLTLDPGYSMPQVLQPGIQQETVGTNQPETPRPRVQNPGGSQNGGVTQQFSQGATGGNPVMDYQKQQMKGFTAQEKAQKKALKELLKSIKNQYSVKQTEGLNQLAKSKQEDLLKLSGLFSFANQDPNSEQRMQYEQRANQDYATQQSDFLAKLASAMQGDISSAKQGYQKELAGIGQQRNTAQEKIAELLMQAQKPRGSGSQSAGSVTYIGNDAQGNPVYRNTQTGAMETYPGISKPAGNPVATGDWQVDPEDGKLKQVYLQNGQPGFIY